MRLKRGEENMTISDDMTSHFAGIILTIFLAATQGRIGRIGSFWQILYAVPGTILHETAHFLVALVTGGRPSGFTIIPRARECTLADGSLRRMWVLGSVTIGNAGTLSAVPAGLAPLLLIGAAYYLFSHWFAWFPADLPHTLLMYLTVYLFSYSSIPSPRDIKVACSSLTSMALYGGLFALVWLFRNELLPF
jgi:hypothetical protein